MKVAIVCDWLLGTGGAERVVLELHKMFPDAPIYTSQYNSKSSLWYGDKWFADADIRTTWLQRLPKAMKKFLPVLRAWTFSRLDLSEYDLVISSSGAEAKAVKTGKNTVHITYCHAPTHYYWRRYYEYLKHPGFGLLNPLARLGLLVLVSPMRRWDRRAAQRPDHFIANSHYTKEEIKKYYGRESEVINPPVDIERFNTKGKNNLPRHGFVVVGRQTPYKKINLAVLACTQLDLALKVIGSGPEHNKLVKSAGPRVTFLTGVADTEIAWHLQQAEGFIFPGVDDFGIVAVEALAAGTPIIAYRGGGALDYVKEGDNGLFFDEQTVPSLIKAIDNFQDLKFNNTNISRTAEQFSSENFTKNIKIFIEKNGKA